jgi:metallo-beta-lactamase family protein
MSIRLRFHGAAQTVTGSSFAIETDRARILVDCGLFQGSKSEKELNYRPFPFEPRGLDAVILTHAHIDHSGLLPKLVKNGFAGPIFATAPTLDLCSVMLPDSGHIQEMEVQQLNRRNAQRGRGEVEAIYTAEDAIASLTQFRAVEFKTWITIADGIRARFWNAGHLLGSASVELEVTEAGQPKPTRLLFSGDIGPKHKLLQFDPEAPQGFDHVICESTYGDTDRPDATPEHRRQLLRDEVRAALRPTGALLVPSFAVERTQELLVDLVGLMEAGEIPRIPIFIDSPLATRASAVFEKHARAIEEGEALERALNSHHVRFTEAVEQSKAIERIRSFSIIIAASGMCEAGRIRHHLKNWLWREEATVLLVGFQAQGTLGRILQDGASRVRLMGEEVRVRARIRSLDLYSGHADGPQLAQWMKDRRPVDGQVFLVHGESDALAGMKRRVEAIGLAGQIVVPGLDEAFELKGAAVRAIETDRPARIARETVGHLDWHNALSRLLIDISEAAEKAADERARGVLLRRLRRALDES